MPRVRWESAIEELSRDNRSGAEEIASRALHLLIDAIGESEPESASSYRRWLLRISREVVTAQPSMGVLFRLVNDMLWATDGDGSAADMREGALGFLQQYQSRSAQALFSLTQAASDHFAGYSKLMTYSRSSTVVNALTAIKKKPADFCVYCGEGRPMFEGQTLASELGWAGVEVTIGIDMALFGWLSEVQALVIGADSVALSGLVNKIGTAELVHAAAERELPRIVLTTTTKFMPGDYPIGEHLREGDPEEVMPVSSNHVTVSNVYFDVTPLEELSAVITEKGTMSLEQLREELKGIETYPGLRRA